jgi:uncharacterized cupin superfamily protein
MGITHFDEAPARSYELGHLKGRWTLLGEAAGSAGVGLRRIQVPAGGWSTPVHDHGRSEEIFYVLAGDGLMWHAGETAPIRAGDCILFHPRRGGHSLHAFTPLDVLAFGPREHDESPRFPRLGRSLVGNRFVNSEPGAIDGTPAQFVWECSAGPPELPDEPGERPATLMNLADAEHYTWGEGRFGSLRADLGTAVGSVRTGLKHIRVDAGKLAAPLHCHSMEEELFVILDGEGFLMLDSDEIAVSSGHVVSRPAGSGVSHTFRAAQHGLEMLAYGTREPGDICYYPTSNKVSFRGIGLIGRLEQLDYWDGED